MVASIVMALLVLAFLGAGLVNLAGHPAMQDRFAGWCYPRWWCRPTGAIEIVAAVLVAIPSTRSTGLIVGAAVIAAALATVLRHRDLSHLVPIGLFVVLLAIASVDTGLLHL